MTSALLPRHAVVRDPANHLRYQCVCGERSGLYGEPGRLVIARHVVEHNLRSNIA